MTSTHTYVPFVPDGRELGDGAVLVAAIEEHHPDPFREVSRDVLLREAARVDALDSGDRALLTVELMRTIALLGARNGHTAIHPLDEHGPAPLACPLDLYELEDGVFVTAAAHTDLVGSKLTAVNGVDIDDVLRAVAPLVARDNEWTVRARRPAFTVDPSVLHGLGLSKDDRRATFRLRSPDGSELDIALESVSFDARWTGLASGTWLADRVLPAYLRRRREPRWVERSADGRVVHVAYNVTRGDITAFAEEVETLTTAAGLGVVVVDLRHNGGGDNRTYAPLLHVMERLDERTRLAVLTSRTTFSAAMQFVVDLEQKTPAVFVGEPTGGSPNQYGDAVLVPLRNSGARAFVATISWTTAGEADQRLTREPDIPVLLDSTAYFSGHDIVLDAAIAALS